MASELPASSASSAVTVSSPPATRSGEPRRDAATMSLVILAVIALGAVFTWMGPVLRPFLIAVFLSYAARFFARLLTRVGLSPAVAYASLLPVAVILTILFGQLVHREAGVFLAKWPRYEARIMRVIDTTGGALRPWSLFGPAAVHGEDAADHDQGAAGHDAAAPPAPPIAERPVETPPGVGHTVPAADDTGLGPGEPRTGGDVGALFRTSSQAAVDYVFRHSLDVAELFILVLVYLVFLFLGGRKLPAKIRRAFPGEQGERILRIGAGITDSMEAFMAVKTFVGLGMGLTAGLMMFAMGLDHWLLWAFLFFASNYITYIGSAVTIVPPIVLAFFDFTSPWAALLLAVLLLVNRLVWIDFIEIRLSGRELNLDPVPMFLWLAYWGWVWGVLGLILAYPMMAAVKIVLQHVSGGTPWAVLLSDD